MQHNTSSLPPVALVTGGARRIGAALCETLHQAGYNIVLHHNRSSAQALKLAQRLNEQRPDSVITCAADLNQSEGINALAEAALQAWQRLDVLINNASTFYPTPITQADESQWLDLLSSNLKAPFFLIQKLAPALKKQRGCVLNISDIFAERPMPGHSIYSIAKAGNNMLTKSLALELAPEIRVNAIAPGAILWPEDEQGEITASPEKLHKIPLAQLGGTEAITRTALFLIKDAPYITGQIIPVDGGRTLNQ